MVSIAFPILARNECVDADDSDHRLMLRVGQKDMAAYRELVGRHLNRGIKVAERMLGNRQDAEDVMQDTCLKIWKEAERWQPKARFSTWLYRVIFNACIDFKRKVVPMSGVEVETLADDVPAADDAMMMMQRARRVKQALQKLPERQRAALILSYYEGVSNQDGAQALNIPLGTFQQLLFRARQGLKNELKDYFVEHAQWMPKRI